MNITARISKVIRTLGIMGIMMALAGMLVNVNSVAAGSLDPDPTSAKGKVEVYAQINPALNWPIQLDVQIVGTTSNSQVNEKMSSDSSLGVELPVGQYNVSVSAPGYGSYTETITVDAGAKTTVKATLSAISVPPVTRAGRLGR